MNLNDKLFKACEEGQGRDALALVNLMDDLDPRNRIGRTPALNAAYNGFTKLALSLIRRGADPNAKDRDGQSFLHHAAMRGAGEEIEQLVALSNHLNAPDSEGRTPLFHALYNHKIDTTLHLMVLGADWAEMLKPQTVSLLPESMLEVVNFPLHFALDPPTLCARLMDAGFDPKKKDKFGFDALMSAEKASFPGPHFEAAFIIRSWVSRQAARQMLADIDAEIDALILPRDQP